MLPMANAAGKHVNSNVVSVTGDTPIKTVVELMTEKNISSVLVTDLNGDIKGIITERDIVQKFTLLNVADKLTRAASAIMKKPVMFAHVDKLPDEIMQLHLKHKVRHFPVLKGTREHISEVVAIVSITDIARSLFVKDGLSKQWNMSGKELSIPKRELGVIGKLPDALQLYRTLFDRLGYHVVIVTEVAKYLKDNEKNKHSLIFDMDGYTPAALQGVIAMVKKYDGYLIMATSQPQNLPVFKKYLDHSHQEICLKPLDISYCDWMLTRKWQGM